MNSTLSPTQREQRAEGITATDIAGILGVHPNRRPIDVWLEKTGQAEPFAGNDRTKWGVILEPIIRKDYEARHGVRVEVHGTHRRKDRPWMLASPDGLVYQGAEAMPERGLEIKTHTVWLTHHYGTPGTDEVPLYELAQTAWGMAVTDLPRWDLVLFADNQPTEYIIDRDDDLIGSMIERGERFLMDHVRAKVPPPADGSDRFGDYLVTRYKSANADGHLVKIDDNADMMATVDSLRRARATFDEAEALKDELEQRIKAFIGSAGDLAAGIEWGGGKRKPEKITWKAARGSLDVNHTGIVAEMRTAAAVIASAKAPEVREKLDKLANLGSARFVAELRALLGSMSDTLTTIAGENIIEKHTTLKPGSRRICVPATWKAKTK